MKTSRICALVLLTLLCSLPALADSFKDPQIIIKGAQGGGFIVHCPPQGCTPVGTSFTFTSPANGEGKVFFTNASGKNWTSLKLIESAVPAGNISCQQSLFLSCKIFTLKDGKVEILLSGVRGGTDNPRNGILAGSSFFVGFGCVKGVCWPKGGVSFSAQANAVVPEPATVALLVTGVGLIGSRRKLWKNRWNA